jgi:riboflavin biosynthesis pyrimidine reductase
VATITFTRLYPAPGLVEAEALVASLEPDPAAPRDRPYVIANFVSSADGRATFEGRSGALGDDGDRALFHALRERVDAVMAGTTTLRAENYGRVLGKSERRERRAEYGKSGEPIACTISRSGRIPWEIPLFGEPDAVVVVFCPDRPARTETNAAGADVRWERLPVDEPAPLTAALRTLRRDYGTELLLCEGGPTLFAALLAEHAVDELFLTLAPKLTGGGDPKAITAGPPLPELAQLRLRWLLERESSLFLRYAVNF